MSIDRRLFNGGLDRLLTGSLALVLANGITLTLVAWIGWFKLRFG